MMPKCIEAKTTNKAFIGLVTCTYTKDGKAWKRSGSVVSDAPDYVQLHVRAEKVAFLSPCVQKVSTSCACFRFVLTVANTLAVHHSERACGRIRSRSSRV